MTVLHALDVGTSRLGQRAVHVSPDRVEPHLVRVVTRQPEPVLPHQLGGDVIVVAALVA